MLVIKYKYRGPKLQKVEKYIHFFPIMFGLVTAVTALELHLYNFAVWDCWIAPDPIDNGHNADGSGSGNGGDDNEKLARVLQWSFFFAPLWCAILYATNNMVLVYLQVRKEEKESMEWLMRREEKEQLKEQLKLKYELEGGEGGEDMNNGGTSSTWLKSSVASNASSTYRGDDITSPAAIGESDNDIENGDALNGAESGTETKNETVTSAGTCTGTTSPLRNSKKKEETGLNMKHTKSIATQGMLYVGAFFITWLFPTISRIIQLCGRGIPQTLVVLSGTSIPSQGIFNAMVYFRLRFIQCGKDFPNKSCFWRVTRIIKSTVCPCFLNLELGDDGNDVEPSISGDSGNGHGGHEHGGHGHGGHDHKHGHKHVFQHGHRSSHSGDGVGQKKICSIPASSPADSGRLNHGNDYHGKESNAKHIKGNSNRNDHDDRKNDNRTNGDGSASESIHKSKNSRALSKESIVSYPSSLSERDSNVSYNVSGEDGEEFIESQWKSRSKQSSSCSIEGQGDGCKSQSATGVLVCTSPVTGTGTSQQQSLSPPRTPRPKEYYRLARDMIQSGDLKKLEIGIPTVPIASSGFGGESEKGISKCSRTYRDILQERRMAMDAAGAGYCDREWLGNGDRVLRRSNLVADLSTIVEDSGLEFSPSRGFRE